MVKWCLLKTRKSQQTNEHSCPSPSFFNTHLPGYPSFPVVNPTLFNYSHCVWFFLLFFFKDFILFLERGEGRERNITVWLPLMHPALGTWPAIQACALTGDRTGDRLLCRLTLNPLSHTTQGWFLNALSQPRYNMYI